jgi:HK97 family phage portal protein
VRSLIGGVAAALKPRSATQPMEQVDTPVPYTARRNINAFASGSAGARDTQRQLSMMGEVGTLFGVVHRTTTSTAEVDWRLYRKAASGKDEDRTPVETHAALDLLEANPFFSFYDLVEMVQQHIDLSGRGFLILYMIGKFPLEIWWARPDRMRPVPHPTKYLAGWVYTGPDGEEVPLSVAEVIPLRMPDPLDPYGGLSPVTALSADLDSTRYAADWNRNFFVNSAEPGGVVEMPEELDDDEFRKFQERWAEQHRGVSRAHRVALLEGGAHWVDRTVTQKDMQFVQLRTASRDTIMEAYTIHKGELGIAEDVNRANADAGEAIFAKRLTRTRLRRWKAALNGRILPMYGATAKGLEFDFDNPVPEDEEAERAEMVARAQAAQAYASAGFPLAAIAEALELPTALRDAPEPPPPPAPVINPPGPPAPPAEDAPPPVPAQAHRLDLPRAALEPAAPGPEQVDHTETQATWERMVDQLMAEWGTVTTAQHADLLAQITAAVDRGDLPALTDLSADSAEGEALLADYLDRMGVEAAHKVTREAMRQGVDGMEPHPPKRSQMADLAAVTSALVASSLALSAGREAMRVQSAGMTGVQVADLVGTYLKTLTPPRAELGGALTGAQNQGRIETMRHGPEAALYADERMDSNTCLAPEVLVTTSSGPVRAERVTLEHELLTHAGHWTRPSHITISEVDESLVVVALADGRVLRLTDDHPVLALEAGALEWRDAGKLAVGELVVDQSTLELGGEIAAPDLTLGQSPHDVAPRGEVGGLAAVDMRAQRVPIGAVGFDDQVADEEVHRPGAYRPLRRVVEVQSLELLADGALEGGLEAAGPVAPVGAVAPKPSLARRDPEAARALLADDDDGWAPAGFGAVVANGRLSVTERGAASAACGGAAACGCGAGPGAVVVPISVARGDDELAGAMGTGLGDAVGVADPCDQVGVGVLAGDRAVDRLESTAAGDLGLAGLAELGDVAAAPPLEGGVGLAAGGPGGDLARALGTRSVHAVSVVDVRYEPYRGLVYDFTVPGDETFFAEGVLVHNCKNCREINGRWIGNTSDGVAMAEVERLYPQGGYVDCLGRSRCRGTVTGIWRKGVAE